MGKKVHQIWFKHKTGSIKRIPGVVNYEQLAPKLTQVVTSVNGVRKPMLQADMNHIVKLTLLDEEADVKLTEKEQKLPKAVQERILARRAEEVDKIIRANEMIRAGVRHYEVRGDVEVIDYDKEVDVASLDSREAIVAELSPIAIADFESRGIEIPERMKRVGKAVAENSGTMVREAVK
jgi:hypothetical protein